MCLFRAAPLHGLERRGEKRRGEREGGRSADAAKNHRRAPLLSSPLSSSTAGRAMWTERKRRKKSSFPHSKFCQEWTGSTPIPVTKETIMSWLVGTASGGTGWWVLQYFLHVWSTVRPSVRSGFFVCLLPPLFRAEISFRESNDSAVSVSVSPSLH